VLLAGTAEEAVLYRVQPDGRARALHDFEAEEIRAIVRSGSAVYLAVNDFDRPPEPMPAPPANPQPGKGTKVAAGPAPASGAVPRSDHVKARAAVYRIDEDGGIEQVFSLPDGYLTSLLAVGAGELLAASGTQGKVYRIGSDRSVALAIDVAERQVLSLLAANGDLLVGCGDVGGVFRVRPAVGTEASYLSKVIDADGPARWGSLRWTGSTDLAFEARTGNTARPDASWTGWKRLEAVRRQAGAGQGKLPASPARYLQYRVVLPGKSSVLREVTAYALPQNQRARVTEVYLADAPPPAAPAVAATPAANTPAASTAAPPGRNHSPVLKLRWKVENPDNDELIYRLAFRQEGEAVWRPLGGPEPLTKPEYDWNTESVPDGDYVIRVWASDEKVTPTARALDATFESPPFLVDNTRPEILDLQARPPLVSGRARDALSVITQLEFSVDGEQWRPLAPADHILDETAESFTLRLPKLAPGPHIVTIRAWDAADNLGTACIQIVE
jgi:hypothetical protein